MSQEQLKRLLRRAKLTGREAARLLDLSERTMYRYTAGRQTVPVVIEYALKWIAAQRRNPRA
jgi:predicted DNA-binding transcriptional regulator YafY